MTTGYHLSLGYCSGSSGDSDPEKNWQALVRQVEIIRQRPSMIVGEVQRLGSSIDADLLRVCAEDMSAEAAAAGSQALTVIDEPKDLVRGRQVVLMASGGNPGRTAKEAVRRAFCRIVIEEMHRRGIEVSLVVA